MEAIIHIGMPKTGSTFVQSVYGANSVELSENGVLFPNLYFDRGGHHLLARTAHKDLCEDRVADCLSGFTGEKILLSSEDFYIYDSWNSIKFCLEVWGVTSAKVICFVRNPFVWISKMVEQMVKESETQWTLDDDVCLDKRMSSWSSFVEKMNGWSSVCEDVKIEVIGYPETPKIDSLQVMNQFLEVDVQFSKEFDNAGVRNYSIDRSQLSLVEYSNLLKLSNDSGRNYWLYNLMNTSRFYSGESLPLTEAMLSNASLLCSSLSDYCPDVLKGIALSDNSAGDLRDQFVTSLVLELSSCC